MDGTKAGKLSKLLRLDCSPACRLRVFVECHCGGGRGSFATTSGAGRAVPSVRRGYQCRLGCDIGSGLALGAVTSCMHVGFHKRSTSGNFLISRDTTCAFRLLPLRLSLDTT